MYTTAGMQEVEQCEEQLPSKYGMPRVHGRAGTVHVRDCRYDAGG